MNDCVKFHPQMREGKERSGCLRCGQSRAAHDLITLPADEIAKQWLIDNGHQGRPYFELVRNILESFIRSKA